MDYEIMTINDLLSNELDNVSQDQLDEEIKEISVSKETKKLILDTYFEVGDSIENGKIKEAILKILSLIKKSEKRLEECKSMKSQEELNILIFE